MAIKYKITPLMFAIHRENQNPVFGEQVTHIQIEDEAGGPFLILKQEDQEIRLDPEELDEIVMAAKELLENYPGEEND